MLHVIFSEFVLINNVDESNLGSKDSDSIQHFSFGPDEKSLTIPRTASTLLLLHKGVVLLPSPSSPSQTPKFQSIVKVDGTWKGQSSGTARSRNGTSQGKEGGESVDTEARREGGQGAAKNKP